MDIDNFASDRRNARPHYNSDNTKYKGHER